jgi:hypothetical protein
MLIAMPKGDNRLPAAAWQPAQKRFQRDGDVFVCDNGADAKAARGMMQTVVLGQTRPEPIIAAAWSRAEGVTGSPNSDYSIYLDLTYADGTHLWGQSSAFDVGTHDWQQRRVRIVPDKPVQTVHCYLLFRNHSGKVWFRDPVLQTLKTTGATYLFDGLAIQPIGNATEDFQIRDAAADSDIVRLKGKPLPPDSSTTNESTQLQANALGVNLTWHETKSNEATFFDVTLASENPAKARAVTLFYTIPIAGKNVQWLCGPRQPIPVEPSREYCEITGVHAGMGRLSRYPLAAVSDGQHGTAVGIDMANPAVFRAAYNSGTGELFLAYDIGLTPEKPTAHIRFCRFTFEPTWGFRAALDRYYRLFPDAFHCRTPQQGQWMPFAPISKIKDWQDFGFKFKEGDDETKWDDAHGIVTFRYTEPMTWWMPMPKEMPRTLDAALAEAKRLAKEGNVQAKAFLTSGMHDSSGRFAARLIDTPWCNGAVWSTNSMPGIAGDSTDFKTKWNNAICEQLYGPKRNADLDGEYIDSSEGYVTEELDFRRENFGAADTPLTFSPDSFQPAIYRGLVAFEYARGLAKDVHARSKLMMGNATPGQLCWLAPQLDVMGTETNWNPGNQWQPMSDAELFYRRALCKGKPYCFLMNTHFDHFPKELTERFMQRSLAYGMFPGFFSEDAATGHYFSRPELYERDRPLFKKYMPLCKQVAEAGWEPITAARSSDDKVHLERFGRYLTVFNPNQKPRTTTITLDAKSSATSRELVRGGTILWADGKTTVTLGAESVAVLELP